MRKIKTFIKKNPAFTVFFILAVLLVGTAVFAPLLAPYDPYEAVLADAVQPPSSEHWFGTDRMGRDLFSRVIYGSRTFPGNHSRIFRRYSGCCHYAHF